MFTQIFEKTSRHLTILLAALLLAIGVALAPVAIEQSTGLSVLSVLSAAQACGGQSGGC